MGIQAANGLARILKAEGVSWVSTFPVCGLNNSLGDEGIQLIMMRDERYAVALADAFSRVTNGKRIGVCTVMAGANAAGLQMAYGALAQAYEDSSPVLCLADGMPPSISGSRRFDLNEGFGSVTKWIGYINQPERTPEFLRQVFTKMRTGRPGPVLLTMPRRLGEYDETEFPYEPVKGWRSAPDLSDIKDAITALRSAKRPLILAGEGIHYAGAAGELLEFAELANLPVVTSLKGKSVFPENHALSLGTRGHLSVTYMNECDLVLAIGTAILPSAFSHAIPDDNNKTIIHCTNDEADINRHYRADHAVLADAKLTLQALTDELIAQTDGDGRDGGEFVERIPAIRREFMAEYQPLLDSADTPINPYRVYGDLMKVLDPLASFVTPDSGTTRDQTATIYQSVIPRGFYGWGTVSTLGFGLAAAAAAKLAYPDRQCVNVTGDAGVSYMLGNFEPLQRNGIGVTTVHINNGGFAGYGPGFWGDGHDPYTHEVSDAETANMSAAMRDMGYYAERVSDPDEVIPALMRCLEQNKNNKPAYLEVICSQYPVFGAWAKADRIVH